MIRPDFNQLKNRARYFDILPISLEIEGDMETPITLYKKLCQETNSFLLESVEGGEKWGRYSYIGRKPFMTLKAYGHNTIIDKNGVKMNKQGKPVDILESYMEELKGMPIKEMPDFQGGAVGYIGYDIVRDYEGLEDINEDDINIPDAYLLFPRELIVYDHPRQKIIIIVNIMNYSQIDLKKEYEACRKQLYLIKDEIIHTNSRHLSQDGLGIKKQCDDVYQSTETKETFMEKVKKAKEYILNGHIFQVVLSQRLEMKIEVDPFKVYRCLRSINPSPYMYYLNFKDFQVVGASPELLVKVKDRVIETCPIAGTRPRGKTDMEDERLAKELLGDEKELAEHLMLVDLGRNDMGKVSQFGTVTINQFQNIHRYSHVMHMVSHVSGKLKDECHMFDALIACIPAGTVSGAPKIRAMEIIDELESRKRGFYAGALGYFGYQGDMDMCITIRTILFKNNRAYIQAGAGIVADSHPEKEYEETLRKAEALIAAIKKAKEGLS